MKKNNTSSLKVLLGLIAAFSLTQASQTAQREQKTVRFRTLAKHSISAVSEKKTVVIKDDQDWVKWWQALYADSSPIPQIPAVDFKRKMVVAVFAGDKPSSGHQILIRGISKIGEPAQVLYGLL